jgi:hypothetical protein
LKRRTLLKESTMAAAGIALVTGASMMTEWPTFALFWHAPRTTGGAVDPIFGKAINFYLFALPRGSSSRAGCFIFATSSTGMLSGRRSRYTSRPWRGFSIAFGFLLLILAMRIYRPIRAIVRRTYDLWWGDLQGCERHASWDARRLCRARSWRCDCNHQCRGGTARSLAGGSSRSSRGLLSRASNIRLYISSFIVKPNELDRERPYIAYNIDLTRQAYGLDRLAQRRCKVANSRRRIRFELVGES